MKKQKIQLVLLVAIAYLMTACNFTTNFSDSTGNTKMEACQQVEDMMTALSQDDRETALALMYPEYASKLADIYEQLAGFMDGRKVSNMTQKSVNIKKSNGTDGKVQQETATFLVALEDGMELYLSVCYVTESNKEGFVSFQLVLGVV